MSTHPYATNEIQWLNPETIEDSPFQPRTDYGTDEEKNDLVASVKEHGVLQPIMVRPVSGKKHKGIAYQAIYGHRRKWAAGQVGVGVPAMVREMDDTKAAAVALLENIQRKDITDLEEARAVANVLRRAEENMTPLSARKLAQQMGKSTTYVTNCLNLLKVKPDVQAIAAKHNSVKLSCIEINKLPTAEDRQPLLQLVEAGTGYRDIKKQVDRALEDIQHKRDSQRAPDAHTAAVQGKATKDTREAKTAFENAFNNARAEIINMKAWAAKAPAEIVKQRREELQKQLAQL